MIIFDLDGTLADCEHRKHFIDRSYLKACTHWREIPNHPFDLCDECKSRFRSWKPDWKSFNEACDKDNPIQPVIEILDGIYQNTVNFYKDVQIWSGRSESLREKTNKWLEENILWDQLESKITLKMRPVGDSTPDDVLKEKWLDEALSEGKQIDFVFDDRPKVIRMWRRRGIFVFNCCQHDEEF